MGQSTIGIKTYPFKFKDEKTFNKVPSVYVYAHYTQLSPHNINLHQKPLPFFCRLEKNVHKKTNQPIYFRLGNLDYTNSLEYPKD
ncbi:MAG: hypothetical protein M3Q56_11280 [Bacteroidota bacterium]|nr:hypothetical protein [Bacteroidota bacterium]